MYGLIVPPGVPAAVAEALERFAEYLVPVLASDIQIEWDKGEHENMVAEWVGSALQQFLRDGEVADGK